MAELLQCIKSCDLLAEDAEQCLEAACSAACTVVSNMKENFSPLKDSRLPI